jgi:hypothetical protein
LALQVTLFPTAGKERKRGGGCYRHPVSQFVFAAAREPTRRQVVVARGGDAQPLFKCPETFRPLFLQLHKAFLAILVDF